jgi:hypothetical protein
VLGPSIIFFSTPVSFGYALHVFQSRMAGWLGVTALCLASVLAMPCVLGLTGGVAGLVWQLFL